MVSAAITNIGGTKMNEGVSMSFLGGLRENDRKSNLDAMKGSDLGRSAEVRYRPNAKPASGPERIFNAGKELDEQVGRGRSERSHRLAESVALKIVAVIPSKFIIWQRGAM